METPPSTSEPKPRRRLPLIALGGVVALLAGGAIAWVLVAGDLGSKSAPPASETGLVIDSSGDEGRIDPGKPLRCFVQGQLVGELSLTECAKRNGVATDALDVGIDETGALAAADQAGQTLTPLPPVEEEPAAPEAPAAAPDADEPGQVVTMPSAGTCWRHGGGRWRRLGDMELNACVQTLFAGRCEKAGGASYGRFGQQTLRLVTGKVEVSDDNKSFHTLAAQAADCSLPPVG
jgi:hypothetical protein